MILKKCILTRNDCYQKGQKMDNGKPTGIVVHSTGANNPSIKRYVQPLKTDADYAEIIADLGVNQYKNSWNVSYKAGETTRQVCVHAFIGKNAAGVIETYQTLPFDICCWGCASGKNGSYNRNPTARVQFEICEDGLTDRSYFDAVFKEAAEFCAYLCKMYGFGVDKICSHYESYFAGYGNNHGDPDHWLKKFGLNMDWFRGEVQKLLDAGNIPEREDAPSVTDTQQENTPERGDLTAGDLVKIASGATYYSGKEVPAWVLGQNWYVKSVSGDRAVIDKSESGKNSINSPINVKYLTPVSKVGTAPTNTTVAQPAGKTNAEIIWDFLMGEFGNEYGVAGLMGNLKAESALQPNNLQGSYEKSLGFTDDTYTAAVDNGTYDNFVHDSAGYGLAQWTYYSRKQNLLDYAKEKGCSIGDLGMQLEFLVKELKAYSAVYSGLKNAVSVKEASDIVMTKYEKPANQSDENKAKRASLGQAYYDQFVKGVQAPVQSSSEAAVVTANMKRQMVVDKYTTILGRNIYNQSRRDYCFKPYSDGKYYSDCSSSVSYCYKEAGFGFGILNTVGMYQSEKLKEVPVQIKNGQIQNPEILRKGDMLLFAGTDTGRAYAGYVGHVEMVYDIDGETVTLCGHGSGNPSTKNMVTYCKSRYTAKASTPVGNKGLIKVVRYIQDDGTEGQPLKLGDRTLRKGSKGVDVRELQSALMALGYALPKYGADGDYGSETVAAVTAFQKDHGLTADGVYGVNAHKALVAAMNQDTASEQESEAEPTIYPVNEVICDISQYQKEIDMDAFCEGTDFAIMRARVNGNTDTKFKERAAEFVRRGYPFAVYDYLMLTSVEDAVKQADAMYDLCSPYGVRIYYLDTEKLAEGVEYEQEFGYIKAYVSRLRERGVEIVGQYTGDNRWNNYYYKIQDVFDTLWIARWNTNEGFYTGWEVEAMRKSDKVDLHQFTSQANAKEYGCPGITTRVDMSRLTGTRPLEWFTERLQNAEAPTITPTIGDGTVAVTGSTVNVRSGPGTAYDVVSVAHKGDTLKRADCDGWVPVIVDGKVCWISGEYVKSHVES